MKFNTYYILQHCKIDRQIKISETIRLSPFINLRNDFRYLFHELKEYETKTEPLKGYVDPKDVERQLEQIPKIYEERNPCSILEIRDIEAENKEDAVKKVEDERERIVNILSLFLNINIKPILIDVIYEISKEKKCSEMELTTNGVNFKEHQNIADEETIRNWFDSWYPRLHATPTGDVALNWYYAGLDAGSIKTPLSTEDIKTQFLSFWYSTEMIAEAEMKCEEENILNSADRKKIFDMIMDITEKRGKSLNDLQKDRVKSFIGQMNYPSIKEMIKAALKKRIYCEVKGKIEEKEYSCALFVDDIDFLYQVRNCIVHDGTCDLIDKNTLCSKPELKCRAYYEKKLKIATDIKMEILKNVRSCSLCLAASRNNVPLVFEEG